ncbi:MAG: hypothetical protein K1X71_04405 [Pirellulales bacterium]|nr:hypothetical protein [Pirellulales bacterium]
MTKSENPYQATVYERLPEERPPGARFNIGVWRQRMFITFILSFAAFPFVFFGAAIVADSMALETVERVAAFDTAFLFNLLVFLALLLAWFVLSVWERLSPPMPAEARPAADLPPV